MYIVFEWSVWTGKTTQSKILVKKLQQEYPDREVLRVREPGSSPITNAIRTLVQATQFDEEMDALAEAYLYAASRAQSLNTIVFPALDRWAIVVSDRSFISSLAYQWYAMTWDIEAIWTVNKPIVNSRLPDVVFYFDMDVEKALARTFDTDWDKHESKGLEFFHKVEEWYQHVIQDARFSKLITRIDVSWDVEQVEEKIRRILKTWELEANT